MNLEQIIKQISRFSKSKSILSCYEVELLPSILNKTENILYVLTGSYEDNNGIVVCTEKRLIFIHKGLQHEIIESFEYIDIDHTHFEINELHGKIELFKRGTRYSIENLLGQEAKLLNDFISKRKMKPFNNVKNGTVRESSENMFKVN